MFDSMELELFPHHFPLGLEITKKWKASIHIHWIVQYIHIEWKHYPKSRRHQSQQIYPPN